MNFTQRIKVRRFIYAVLASAVLGFVLWTCHAPIMPPTSVADQSAHANAFIVETQGLQATRPYYYQPVASWSKTKHWLKRNAPIVGGAGVGAAVGGLVGGGTGALVGGGLGAGGGYLYKRHQQHQRHQYHSTYYKHHRQVR